MSDTVRVKVKATGIIRTITRANYLLSQSKYEILEEEAPAPKAPPQEKEKKAAEPVVVDDLHIDNMKYYTKGSLDFISGNSTGEITGVTKEEAAELAPLLTKKRPGRKPKQA